MLKTYSICIWVRENWIVTCIHSFVCYRFCDALCSIVPSTFSVDLPTSIGSNNLVGTLPEEIGVLTGLERLLLGFNTLSSSIPSSLFKLSKLSIVDFSSNSLSGPIPESLSQATSLQTLHLGYNRLLEGPIASSFEAAFLGENRVCRLEVLVLAENVFSGIFPLDVVAASCTNLTALNLQSSGLTGESLPSTGLERLTILNLRQMGLTGNISDSISRLSLLVELTSKGVFPTLLVN